MTDATITIVSSLFHLAPAAMNPFPLKQARNKTTGEVHPSPGSTMPYTRVPTSEEVLEYQSAGTR